MTIFAWMYLAGCAATAPADVAPTDTAWVSGVQPWYCGAELLEGKESADGTRVARSRDLALKLAPSATAVTGTYGLENAGEHYVGSLTRFESTGERTAKLRWENDHKQKGDALLTFSPDFQTLEVTWQVGAEASSGTSKLTAAADPSTCPAAKLIR